LAARAFETVTLFRCQIARVSAKSSDWAWVIERRVSRIWRWLVVDGSVGDFSGPNEEAHLAAISAGCFLTQ
jgi:hypothetical protein